MIEIFSKPIDPRETKNFHIDNVSARIKDRKDLDSEIQKLPKLSLTACNVCGGSNRSVVFNTNGDDWVQCSNCRHIYKASIPSPLHLEKFFKESTVEVYLDESDFEYRIQNITKPKYEFMMDQYSGEKGRWLDLATGLGDMPFFARDNGWDVEATELNRAFIDFAKENLKLNIHQKNIFDFFEFFKKTNVTPFDVIGGFGYYDMLDKPVEHCQLVNKMLKLGGLHGINLPNHDSFSGKMVEWRPNSSLRKATPINTSCFCMDSIEKMLKLSGFEIKSVLWHGLDIHELIVRLVELDPNFRGTTAFDFLYESFNDLQSVIDKKRQSDLILICAEKVREA